MNAIPKTNWTLIPQFEMNIGKLSTPAEICTLMKKAGIDKYLYRIVYKGTVLKFGMSADNSKNYGERLYRQIAHSASWGKLRISGSSGADWRIVESDFYDTYGAHVDKDHMIVTMWDCTNYPFVTINPWDEVNRMEAELIQQYVDVIGQKPIGNINDEANVTRKARIKKSTWDELFTA